MLLLYKLLVRYSIISAFSPRIDRKNFHSMRFVQYLRTIFSFYSNCFLFFKKEFSETWRICSFSLVAFSSSVCVVVNHWWRRSLSFPILFSTSPAPLSCARKKIGKQKKETGKEALAKRHRIFFLIIVPKLNLDAKRRRCGEKSLTLFVSFSDWRDFHTNYVQL